MANLNTDVQAKLLAYQMTRKYFADSPEKLTAVLQDAKVDLNPHQVEAALFAFKSPFSKGAILADEVGLGKTIEAGLVLSENWAEHKRKILIIVPSSLRKQWSAELIEKFYLPSIILETKSFNENIKQSNFNPFLQSEIVICSYQFAKSRIDYVKAVEWDLIVIDEAHRLRNAYRVDNKTARCLKDNLAPFKKLLLTATPLQNSLLELYSLVSFIDGNVFGDLVSYKQNYMRGELTSSDFADLKKRIKPVVYRTLRRQVLEYVKYTNRIAITQEFEPNADEQTLYENISNYLMQDKLMALPNSQRTLITLIMRKLLASSSFAITDTLKALIARLQKYYAELTGSTIEETECSSLADEDFAEIYIEENDEDEIEAENELFGDFGILNDDEKERKFKAISILQEIDELGKYLSLAESIKYNAKGDSLLIALQEGFSKLKEIKANAKAVIFTESRRTQEYVRLLLEENGYDIVLFNGSNNDNKSKQIYQDWLEKNKNTGEISGSKSADTRAALVDYFRNSADIMIATEAAAEGINLQFCSLVVNYDLPWNPQRIEQRIGRCHRYGQKYDVVVVNFLNTKNLADKRVYELLSEKFKLFDGVFGSSDEVLGSIESGVDFEKRINEIYSCCRTQEEINLAFDELKESLNEQILSRLEQTRKKLLENFDEEVQEKLKMNLVKNKEYIDKFSSNLWNLARYVLDGQASFDEENFTFDIAKPNANNGRYTLNNQEQGEKLRAEHPLAKQLFEVAKHYSVKNQSVTFNLSNHETIVSVLAPLQGKNGQLSIYNLEIGSIEEESYLIYAGVTDDGKKLSNEAIQKLFTLNAKVESDVFTKRSALSNLAEKEKDKILTTAEKRNSKFFDEEMDKLERWCADLKKSLEVKLRQMDIDIKTMKTECRKLSTLAEKLVMQKQIKDVESKRNKLRLNLYEEQDNLDGEKDKLIDSVAEKLKQNVNFEELFTIKWKVV